MYYISCILLIVCAPNWLFKFINDDQVLDEGLRGEESFDTDDLPGDNSSKDLEIMVSLHDVVMVERLYEDIDRSR